MHVRTCVTFESDAFNTSTPQPEFVHPDNFGDDVVRWLMTKFRERHVPVDEEDPSQEDHGWYVTVKVNNLLFDVIVSYAPLEETPRWLISIERSVGLLGSIIGRRRRGVTPEAVRLVDGILQRADECRDVRWFFFDDVQRGNLDEGNADPVA